MEARVPILPNHHNKYFGSNKILSEFRSGLRGMLPLFIDYFLSNCVFKVCVGSTYSSVHPQEMGVPQGIILCYCFSLIVNCNVSCLLPGVNASLYVDDLYVDECRFLCLKT